MICKGHSVGAIYLFTSIAGYLHHNILPLRTTPMFTPFKAEKRGISGRKFLTRNVLRFRLVTKLSKTHLGYKYGMELTVKLRVKVTFL